MGEYHSVQTLLRLLVTRTEGANRRWGGEVALFCVDVLIASGTAK